MFRQRSPRLSHVMNLRCQRCLEPFVDLIQMRSRSADKSRLVRSNACSPRKAVLPHMLAQGCGAIINMSSLAAIRWTGYPYFAYYTAKAAVNQATVALAMQYARHGIHANAIFPGAVDIYRLRPYGGGGLAPRGELLPEAFDQIFEQRAVAWVKATAAGKLTGFRPKPAKLPPDAPSKTTPAARWCATHCSQTHRWCRGPPRRPPF